MWSFPTTPQLPHSFDSVECPGVDESVAKHVAELLYRDPIIVSPEFSELDNRSSIQTFEVCIFFSYLAIPSND